MELDPRQAEDFHCVVTEINIYPIKSCAPISYQTAQITKFGFQYDRKWMVADASSGRMITGRRFPALVQVQPRFSEDMKYLIISAQNCPDLKIEVDAEKAEAGTDVTVWSSPATKAIDEGEEAAQWFSKLINFNVRLVRYPNKSHDRQIDSNFKSKDKDEFVGFADGFPYLLASQESLDNLNSRLAAPITMRRFRPNIVIKATKGGHPWMEDDWNGSTIKIGGHDFRVAKWCERCKMTTIDPATAKFGEEPLKTLATFRAGLHKGGVGKEVAFGQNLVCESTSGQISVGQQVIL